jgi:hypothetical protein
MKLTFHSLFLKISILQDNVPGTDSNNIEVIGGTWRKLTDIVFWSLNTPCGCFYLPFKEMRFLPKFSLKIGIKRLFIFALIVDPN